MVLLLPVFKQEPSGFTIATISYDNSDDLFVHALQILLCVGIDVPNYRNSLVIYVVVPLINEDS